MNVSLNCVTLVKHYEQGPDGGHASKPYLCPAKKWTIGYGHVILPTDKFTYPMDEATAIALLMTDLNKFSVQVTALLKRTPTQDQFDALVSMAFNTGVGKADGIGGDFADSTLLRRFNEGQIQLAAAQFGKWIYGGGKIQPGLVYRRKTEEGLFLTGKVIFYN
jgi:lysozyme